MAKDTEKKIKFKVDSQQYNAAMKQMNADTAKLNKEFRLEQEQLKQTGSASDKLESQMGKLAKEQELVGKKIESTGQHLDEAKRTFGENSKEAQNLEKKLLDLQIAEQRLANQSIDTARKIEQISKSEKEANSSSAKRRQELLKLESEQDRLSRSNERLDQELELQIATMGEGAKETDKLKASQTVLGRQMGNTANQVKNLEQQLELAKKEYGKNSQEVEALEKELLSAKTAYANLGNELDKTNKDLGAFGVQTKTAGENVAKAGGTMSAGVTVPVIALGAASVQAAEDVADSQSKITGALGTTQAQTAKLSATARSIYVDGYGESLEEVTDALTRVKLKMSELDGKELEQATITAMNLASTFDADVNEVVRGADGLMKNFEISSEEAFQKLAWGAQNGLNFSDELFDNISEYAPLFSQAGFSIDEMFAILDAGTQEGAYNLDYVNDLVKEFGIRIQDGSKSTTEAMAEMSGSTKKMFKEYQKGEVSAAQMFKAIGKDLKGMDDQQKATQLGTALFGTKFEDLGNKAVYAMTDAQTGLMDTKGALDKLNTSAESNHQLEVAMRSLQDAIADIGTALAPVMNDVAAMAQEFAAWFKGLDDETKELIIGLAATAAAIGPVTAGIGLLMMTLNPVSAVIGGIGLGIIALGGALAIATSAQKKHDEELTRSIDTATLYGEGVSKGTQKAGASFVKLKDTAHTNMALMKTATVESAKQMSNEVVEAYSGMANKAISALEKYRSRLTTEIDTITKGTGEVGKKSANKATKEVNDSIDKNINKIKSAMETVSALKDKYNGNLAQMTAADQKRYDEATLLLDEQLKVFSKSVSEQEKIAKAASTNQDNISKSSYDKQLTNARKARDASTKEAEKYYKKTNTDLKKALADGNISQDSYNKLTASNSKLLAENSYKAQKVFAGTNKSLAESVKNTGDVLLESGTKINQLQVQQVDGSIKYWSQEKRTYVEKAEMQEEIKRKNEEYIKSLSENNKEAEGSLKDFKDNLVKFYMEAGMSAEQAKKQVELDTQGMVDSVDSSGNKIATHATTLSEKFIKGLNENNADIPATAKKWGLDLESNTKIDLGKNGDKTAKEFFKAIQAGGEEALPMLQYFFSSKLEAITAKNLSDVGKKDMDTLKEGLSAGAITLDQLKEKFGVSMLNIYSNDLSKVGQDNITTLRNGLDTGTVTLNELEGKYKTQLDKIYDKDLTKVGKDDIATLKAGMDLGLPSVDNYLTGLKTKIKTDTKVDIKGVGKTNIDGLVAGFQNGKVNVSQFLTGLRDLQKKGSKQDLSKEGKANSQTFVDGANSKKPAAKTAGKGVASSAKAGAGSVSATQEGKNFGDGFTSGISSVAGKAATAAANMVSDAISAVKKAQKSASPAKKLIPKGGDFVDGYALGIDNNADNAAASAASMAEGAINAVNGSPSMPYLKRMQELATNFNATQNYLQFQFNGLTIREEADINKLVDAIDERLGDKY
ncbi:TPA: phage tail tape measure protein [Listeria monocytogenes]|nr:phage tail tape measure protein [Listeria monocytogenes]HBJ8604351.1 phage tail tape measure protein [Listeria monocytogenes]